MIRKIKATEESGRSMVEMLGVLAIVGVLSIGGITGYSKAMAKYKINKTLDQLSMLITNIRTTFGNQNSYAGLTTATAITYEIAGKDLSLGQTSKLTNAYNGDVTVEDGDAAGAACDGSAANAYCPTFVITFAKLDQNACATVASSDWGGTASSGLVSISIGNNKFEWTTEAGKNPLPISYVTAMSKCAATGDNTLTWVYN